MEEGTKVYEVWRFNNTLGRWIRFYGPFSKDEAIEEVKAARLRSPERAWNVAEVITTKQVSFIMDAGLK